MESNDFVERFRYEGHWTHYELAGHWRAAGEAMSASYPQAARRAFEWSTYYFEAYNGAWSAGLPASRWDSDGGSEIEEVTALKKALPSEAKGAESLPQWVADLLAGSWKQSPGNALPPFDSLLPLVTLCRQGA